MIIGLTGGIATGKTTITQAFKQLGAETLCCDELAHRAFWKSTKTYKEIVQTFGNAILDKEKRVDRIKMADVVFKDKEKLVRLEKIVHPFVFQKIEETKMRAQGHLIIDVPLLFETKYNQKVDKTIVVTCSEDEQLIRLKSRNQFTDKEAKRRIKTQLPLKEKEKKADWIIYNNSLKKALNEVNKIWEQIQYGTAKT